MQFKVVHNDITDLAVDAIVLPANSKLKEGRGTSQSIFEKAGRRKLKRACKNTLKEYGPIDIGRALPTLAYKLNATYIIHSVVPRWIDGNHQEYDMLSAAYLSALGVVDSMGCESIAFPLLASGNNGFDLDIAFEIAKKSIESFNPSNKLKTVILVLYGTKVMQIAKNQGISVEEMIDYQAILEKNDKNNFLDPELLENGKDVVGKVLNDALQKGIDYLNDEEKRGKLFENVGKIAMLAIQAATKKK